MNDGIAQILGVLLRAVLRKKKKGKQNPSVTTSCDSSPRQGSQEPSLTRDLNEVQWTSEPKHVLEHRNMRRKRPAELVEGFKEKGGENE